METEKTFQIKVTYLENGAVKLDQYDKEFAPFELLGIISHVKNEIEADLLCLRKPIQETTKSKYKQNSSLLFGDFVECVRTDIQDKNNSFNVGAKYLVIETYSDYRGRLIFKVEDNNGKKRSFNQKNGRFRALS